jgi:lipid-binding SYLF domain-containing protein
MWLLVPAILILALALPCLAGDKEKDEETFKNATAVLEGMLTGNSVPADILGKADCVIVLPNVKKMGFVVGGTGGRGAMTCRTGKGFDGKWSAPAMYRIGGVSAGLQIGGSSTDYVVLVMSQKGLDAILTGKMKMGTDATAAAGPSGATSSSTADMYTYGKAKGLFAGVSLGGASLEEDKDANKRLYGKATEAKAIVIENSVPAPEAGKALVSLLDSKAAKRGK